MDPSIEIERLRDKTHEMSTHMTIIDGRLGKVEVRMDGHETLCELREKNADRRMTRLEGTISRLMFTSVTASISALGVVLWQIVSKGH